MQRQRFRRRCDHRDACADIRLFAEAKWTERQDLPVGLTENLKTGVRQRVEHDADLHADRLVLHQRDEMLGFGAREPAAFPSHWLGKIEAANQTVAQEEL